MHDGMKGVVMENNGLTDEEKNVFLQSESEEKKKIQERTEELTQQEKRKSFVKEILSWVEVVLISLALAWFIGTFIIMNAYIPSGSMENTLVEGDKLIGNRLAYLFDEPERGDIIMFKYPEDESRDFIKRIIGLPGETVTIKGGKVYIDESEIPLTEDYLKEEPNAADFGPYEIPKDCYFVMGDNRNASNDSRFWGDVGDPSDPVHYVSRDKILAKAVIKWMPKIELLK